MCSREKFRKEVKIGKEKETKTKKIVKKKKREKKNSLWGVPGNLPWEQMTVTILKGPSLSQLIRGEILHSEKC